MWYEMLQACSGVDRKRNETDARTTGCDLFRLLFPYTTTPDHQKVSILSRRLAGIICSYIKYLALAVKQEISFHFPVGDDCAGSRLIAKSNTSHITYIYYYIILTRYRTALGWRKPWDGFVAFTMCCSFLTLFWKVGQLVQITVRSAYRAVTTMNHNGPLIALGAHIYIEMAQKMSYLG
jgi:hypothetical protein